MLAEHPSNLQYANWYFYDESGIYGFQYQGTNYIFEKNIFGDITKIFNMHTGEPVGEYKYDAWGNIVYQTNNTITNANPFRYRGYYYDTESGFYYLNSRYYDPQTGRFINADDPAILFESAAIVGGVNLFAYCSNNPVMLIDPTGYWSWSTFWKGVGMVITGVVAVTLAVTTFGAGIPIAMSIIAGLTLTAGTLTTVNGIATMVEAGTDYNFVRDGVFQGNITAYNYYSSFTYTIAAVGSMILGVYHTTGQYKAAKAGQQYLGKGYTKYQSGIWRSKDGLRQVRWDSMAKEPHFNFETWRVPLQSRVRNKLFENLHVYYKGFIYWIK